MTSNTRFQASRRGVLKGVAGACVTGALAGCPAGTTRITPAYSRPLSRLPFAAPRVSMDKIVRVIVGLRPYRPAGFVVRMASKRGSPMKRVRTFWGRQNVHNAGSSS